MVQQQRDRGPVQQHDIVRSLDAGRVPEPRERGERRERGQRHQPRPQRNEEQDHRPHHVELPFDAHRPRDLPRGDEVLLVEEQRVVWPRVLQLVPRLPAERLRLEQHDDQHEVVDRHDAEHATQVEVAQRNASVAVLLAQQQRRDQEARHHEEDVHAEPAGQPLVALAREVLEDHQEHADRTHAVERVEVLQLAVGLEGRGVAQRIGESFVQGLLLQHASLPGQQKKEGVSSRQPRVCTAS